MKEIVFNTLATMPGATRYEIAARIDRFSTYEVDDMLHCLQSEGRAECSEELVFGYAVWWVIP